MNARADDDDDDDARLARDDDENDDGLSLFFPVCANDARFARRTHQLAAFSPLLLSSDLMMMRL